MKVLKSKLAVAFLVFSLLLPGQAFSQFFGVLRWTGESKTVTYLVIFNYLACRYVKKNVFGPDEYTWVRFDNATSCPPEIY